MEIKIIETYRNHTFIDSVKKFIRNLIAFLIGLIIIPTLLISTFFKKKNNSLVKNIFKENEWFEFFKSESLILLRKSINDENLPENLDLPKEASDIYAFKIKANPEIKKIGELIFSHNHLETEKNIYLISINEIGEQMSLWNIDKGNNDAKNIANIKSLWWEFSKNDDKIFLKATDNSKDWQIEIVEM